MRKVFLFLIVFTFFISFVSALGISPAIKNIDFAPNQEVQITFFVIDAVEGVTYDVSLRGGDLLNYSYLSYDTVNGNGNVVLTIKFPDDIDKPGYHMLSVSVKEKPSEESFINTVVEVGAVIKIFVPYPGIYGDIKLNIPDGNVGDQIPVELHVVNRGDNALDISKVFIDFIANDGSYIKSFNFTPAAIPVFKERYFRKYLDTKDIKPGNYIGSAKLFYSGTINEVNKSFRIGSLFVNITNYTTYLTSGGIKKFYVALENRWNSPISGVYVDINLSNGLSERVFRTPSIDLKPWEEKIAESFFDTEGLEGNYNLILNASYYDKSTIAYGNLFIGKDYTLIIYMVSAVAALIFFIVLYFVLRHFFKRKNK